MNWDEDLAVAKAEEAAKELRKLPKGEVQKIYDWWSKYFMQTGHKKLFRVMKEYVG